MGGVTVMASTPADLAIANKDKIAEMLIANGTITADANMVEIENAVDQYLKKKSRTLKDDSFFNKQTKHEHAKVLKKIQLGAKHKGAHATMFAAAPTKRTDKVLAVLIDFPDLPWDDNQLTPEHTGMYYDSYHSSHYQDLLFSPTGYEGPNGENLISMSQYYESESGNTYSVEGEATRWYRAAKSANYYGKNDEVSDNDMNAKELVREALAQLAADPTINLADYDIEDRYDYDGDGDYNEPDGLIDHLMVFHASIGEEMGGGVLGADAIWAHRWNLSTPFVLEGTTSSLPNRWNGQYAAYDYTIQPIDAAAGICAHEYGHDLGLPDEYDTNYTGKGEPVSYWSIMSSGSWAGTIQGTEPTAFSSYAKAFLQASLEGRWADSETMNLAALSEKEQIVTLHQTTNNDSRNQVRIELPLKNVEGVPPVEGSAHYYSDRGNDLNTSMLMDIDIPSASNVTLKFKAWFNIEVAYDFARVLVNGEPIAGNITTMDDPEGMGLVPAISGKSTGWQDALFDLTPWAGQTISLSFDYVTDGAIIEEGLYVDAIELEVDGVVEAIDNAESTPKFALNGYRVNDGFHQAEHYYLLQWRNHDQVDNGLNHITRMGQNMSFEPGLLIWYVDNSMTDNSVGNHPGEGWLGVVDADTNALTWAVSGEIAQTRYQVRDATFSLHAQDIFNLTNKDGDALVDYHLDNTALFNDKEDYSSPGAPDSGRILTPYGITIEILDQAEDNAYGVLRISTDKADNIAPEAEFEFDVNDLMVQFENGSEDDDGTIEFYEWDFGDGAVSDEVNPAHVYSEAGTYQVTLTVTDNLGKSHSQQQSVEVFMPNQAPVADFGYFNMGGLTFLWSTSYDVDGDIVKTKWKLPNGVKKRGSFIIHYFHKKRNNVTIIVKDNSGNISKKKQKIALH
jgi:immune inhibitor A